MLPYHTICFRKYNFFIVIILKTIVFAPRGWSVLIFCYTKQIYSMELLSKCWRTDLLKQLDFWHQALGNNQTKYSCWSWREHPELEGSAWAAWAGLSSMNWSEQRDLEWVAWSGVSSLSWSEQYELEWAAWTGVSSVSWSEQRELEWAAWAGVSFVG